MEPKDLRNLGSTFSLICGPHLSSPGAFFRLEIFSPHWAGLASGLAERAAGKNPSFDLREHPSWWEKTTTNDRSKIQGLLVKRIPKRGEAWGGGGGRQEALVLEHCRRPWVNDSLEVHPPRRSDRVGRGGPTLGCPSRWPPAGAWSRPSRRLPQASGPFVLMAATGRVGRAECGPHRPLPAP